MRRGKFITVEGGEGAGKSSLITALERHLRQKGVEVVKTREPGGTPFGEEVRRLLLMKQQFHLKDEAELFLFLASRVENVQEVILPALNQGKIVLCDRFSDSTIAYQGAARGLSEAAVAPICHFAERECRPDLTLWLDVDPTVGLERALKAKRGSDRMEAESLLFHEAVRGAFLRLSQQEPNRIYRIDAMQPQEDVIKVAQQIIDEHLAL